MSFKTFYRSLSRDKKAEYAAAAKTSRAYIEGHLMARRRVPRQQLVNDLAKASHGQLTTQDILAYFYQPDLDTHERPRCTNPII